MLNRERLEQYLLRYTLAWSGTNIVVVATLGIIAAVMSQSPLASLLATFPNTIVLSLLDGLMWGMAHLFAFLALRRLNSTGRHGLPSSLLWIGAGLWLLRGIVAFPKGVILFFALIEDLPFILPFLMGGYLLARQWTDTDTGPTDISEEKIGISRQP